METNVATLTPSDYGIPQYAGIRMTKDEFLRWESDDNYVYEFNEGILVPKTGMRQEEEYLLYNLENKFFQTPSFQQGGRLRPELDTNLTNQQIRRPDVSYFTADQIRQMRERQNVVPLFVVEFASKSDNDLESLIKRHQYFNAGVQVVWWVYPSVQEVHLYTSPKTVTICTGTDPLSAAPALPELQLTVDEFFER